MSVHASQAVVSILINCHPAKDYIIEDMVVEGCTYIYPELPTPSSHVIFIERCYCKKSGVEYYDFVTLHMPTHAAHAQNVNVPF